MADLVWAKVRKLLRAPNIGFNAEVIRHFKAEDDTQGRINLKALCLIQSKDSRITAESRIKYFYERILKVQFKPTIVGIPKGVFDEGYIYKPQVSIFFKQDDASVPSGKRPIRSYISFRLVETSESITNAQIASLATRIKSEFALNNGYQYDKGKYIVWYKDREHGYNLKIYVQNEATGEAVVRKILDLQNHTYNSDFFKCTEPKKNSDNTPGTTTILGKTVTKPRWRPTARVRFQYALLNIHGLEEIKTLVDNTGMQAKPLLRGWT